MEQSIKYQCYGTVYETPPHKTLIVCNSLYNVKMEQSV
jgi:hypothetical protein